jgi:hypothetical protein
MNARFRKAVVRLGRPPLLSEPESNRRASGLEACAKLCDQLYDDLGAQRGGKDYARVTLLVLKFQDVGTRLSRHVGHPDRLPPGR